ncbi:MAG: tetratricopeptide repeat protein [Nitrospirota bacterium]|nr:tetratricopeptide repeat protein [Nitrospirota bacterium]
MAIRHWHLSIIIGCWSIFSTSSPVLANFDTALIAYKNGNFTEAFKQLQPLEEQSHPQSQLLLGVMYLEGEGVKRNYQTAAQWFRKSAEQGDEIAEFNLGLLYERGKGVPRDMSQAVYWYRWAAEGSHPDAQFRLARLYVTGKGVKRDTVEALVWLHLAARLGQEDALFHLARLAQQMTKAQVAEAQRQVKEWKALSPVQLDYLFSKEWARNLNIE